MTIQKKDVVQTIGHFSELLAQCDRKIQTLLVAIRQIEQAQAEMERTVGMVGAIRQNEQAQAEVEREVETVGSIRVVTDGLQGRLSWSEDQEGGAPGIGRESASMLYEARETSRQEIEEFSVSIRRLTEKKQQICRIWSAYQELPEKEGMILELLYEHCPERESYAEKIERVAAHTGFSESHISRLASRAIKHIICANMQDNE